MQPCARSFSAAEWRAKILNLDPLQLQSAASIIAKCSQQTKVQLCGLPHGDPLLSGAIAFLDSELRCIWYDNSLSESRRHVVLAHEFAHYALHGSSACNSTLAQDLTEDYSDRSPLDTELIGYSPVERRERDADEWAAELLLPVSALEAAYFGREQDVSSISAATNLDAAFVLRRMRKLLLNTGVRAGESTQTIADTASTLSSLDDSQSAAATSDSRFVLVSAGPGTGKTRTLIGRYEYLLQDKHEEAAKIAILTFSRKAAGELAERCSHIRSMNISLPWIGTIHAYAYELLRRFSLEAGLQHNWSVLSSNQAERLMDRRLASLVRFGNKLSTLPVSLLLRAVSQLKERGIVDFDYHELAKARTSATAVDVLEGNDAYLEELGSFYRLYQRTLAESNKIDFSDLLIIACNLLIEHEDVIRHVRDNCRHLLIDEIQDLTPSALKFIEKLVGLSEHPSRANALPNLWVVGDRLQSIYRFQSGSSICGIESLSTRFTGVARYSLAINYRSSHKLVGLLSDVAAKLTSVEPIRHQRWISSSKDAEEIRQHSDNILIAAASDSQSQLDGIVAEISRLDKLGISPSQQAVLCRTNAQCEIAVKGLSHRGIVVLEGSSWLSIQSVKRLMQRFEMVAYDTTAIGDETSRSQKATDAKPLTSPSALLNCLVFDSGKELRELWNSITVNASAVGDLKAIGALLQEAARWEYEDEIQSLDQVKFGQARLTAFARYIRRLHREQLKSKYTSLSSNSDTDGVHVMTIHAAKGLEFDAVYLPDLVDGMFPRRGSDKRETSLEKLFEASASTSIAIDEESCLFFVGISRAKRYLRLSYPEQQPSGRNAKQSPFLRLIQTADAGKTIKTVHWTAHHPHQSKKGAPTLPDMPTAAALNQLTMTEVAAYEACPRQYWYSLNKPTHQAQTHIGGVTEISEIPSALSAEISRRQKIEIAAAANRQIYNADPQTAVAAQTKSSNGISLVGWLKRIIPTSVSEHAPLRRHDDAADPVQARRLRVANGIAAKSFPAAPDNPERCTNCPFYYVCPD